MKRWAIGVAVLAMAGCGTSEQVGTQESAPLQEQPAAVPATTTAAAPAVPPPDPQPVRDGTCPYLDSDFAAETNGQHVGRVRLSADEPPACFFYRSDGGEQLRVRVLTGADPAVAKALVDQLAPIATSDPASFPGGWEGGKQPTDNGAVVAVAKEGTAVVVVTNQQQTIKAVRIAEQAIETLGL
ncbi:MAG TPA: DUF2020 domain-containing protein [Pseudonocardiaceae bacterium]